MSTYDQLAKEVELLHQRLFGGRCPELLKTRYIAAHACCCKPSSPGDIQLIDKAVSLGLDLEALEFASRSRESLLTKKIALFSYLAEVTPGYYLKFVNDRNRQAEGFVALLYHTLLSVLLFLKGRYLIWRHALV